MLRYVVRATSIWALLCSALGCASPGLGCEGAPLGASGGAFAGHLTLCVFDPDGAPLPQVEVHGPAGLLGRTDAGGALTVSEAGPLELLVEGRLPHTIFANATERFGVALVVDPEGGASTRQLVSVTLGESPPPPAEGALRLVELRASVPLDAASIAEGATGDLLGACAPRGLACTAVIDVPQGARGIAATLLDMAPDGSRVVHQLGAALREEGDEVDISLAPPASFLELSGLPVDAVVGVPGVAMQDEVVFFGPVAAGEPVPLPAGDAPWVALHLDAEARSIGVVQRPAGETVPAPAALSVALEGRRLTLPPGDDGFYSLAGYVGAREVWRGTLVGEEPAELPAELDEVVVAAHGPAAAGPVTRVLGVRRFTLP